MPCPYTTAGDLPPRVRSRPSAACPVCGPDSTLRCDLGPCDALQKRRRAGTATDATTPRVRLRSGSDCRRSCELLGSDGRAAPPRARGEISEKVLTPNISDTEVSSNTAWIASATIFAGSRAPRAWGSVGRPGSGSVFVTITRLIGEALSRRARGPRARHVSPWPRRRSAASRAGKAAGAHGAGGVDQGRR